MPPLILVFLKWPEPGRVKTRLAVSVGEWEAVRIYRALVREVGGILGRCGEEHLAVCYAPPEREWDIRRWITEEALPVERSVNHWWAQSRGDLGRRQRWAVARAFAEGYERVAMIGTDCVDLDQSLIREAWDILEKADWVFGPAADGGYYLGALRRNAPSPVEVFRGVRWSTEHTLADCLKNLERAGGTVTLLKSLQDVDAYENWVAVRERLSPANPADSDQR